MKKCFGYIRVSTTKQGEGVSLEAQKDAIQLFADKQNIEISQWFEEKETAAKSGRPLFNAMIKQLKAGEAAGFVVHKIDRSARNFADWAKIGELADLGIDVHFATESLDFNSRGGRLTADIQAVIAADYIRNLKEECRKGIEGRLKQGLFPFQAPIGYLDNGKGQVKTFDPVRAPLVKEAFNLYASGEYSLHGLRVKLTEIGLLSRTNRPLTKRGIESMLCNPFYCGIILIKTSQETYKGIHKPIVNSLLFQRVQDVRNNRIHKKKTKHNHTYRGLFSCELCGRSMIPEKQKIHVYYRCQTKGCPTSCVREEAIENSIRSVFHKAKISTGFAEKLLGQFAQWSEKQNRADITTIPMQLSKLNSRLDKLTDALLDELITKDTYNERRQSLLTEQVKLEEKRQKSENIGSQPQILKKFLELIENVAELYENANATEKRQLVKTLTSNRLVSLKKIMIEPVDWLQEWENIVAFPNGAHHGVTNRRYLKLSEAKSKQLACFIQRYETEGHFCLDDNDITTVTVSRYETRN